MTALVGFMLLGLLLGFFNITVFKSLWYGFRFQVKSQQIELNNVLAAPIVLFGFSIFTFGHFFVILHAFEFLNLSNVFFKYVFLFSLLNPISFLYYMGKSLPDGNRDVNSSSLFQIFFWPAWCLCFFLVKHATQYLAHGASLQELLVYVLVVLTQSIPLFIFFYLRRSLS